jgi:hypothetical protein
MSIEKHDPWALLATARASVYQHKERLLDCDHDAETCTCDLAAQKIALLARIDAALAERHEAVRAVRRDVVGRPYAGLRQGREGRGEAMSDEKMGDGGLSRTLCIEAERVLKAEEEALKDGVEWRPGSSHTWAVQGFLVEVRPKDIAVNERQWSWSVRQRSKLLCWGERATEAEAQQAALDAARRLS